jgi:predicted dehydrogenase
MIAHSLWFVSPTVEDFTSRRAGFSPRRTTTWASTFTARSAVDDTSLETFTVGAHGRGRTGRTFPDWIAGFKGETKNFVDAVGGTASLETPAEHGVQLMAMIEGIYKSSSQSREVVL